MYYILAKKPLDDDAELARVTDAPDVGVGSWYAGTRFTQAIPQPMRFTIDPASGQELPDFFDQTIPLMHESLVDALRGAGVDNLDVYDAVIVDEESGDQLTEYKAVNVIGAMAVADLDASDFESAQPTPRISVSFNKLVIDESRARGLLLFRLAECVSAIVVHEKVRKAVEERGAYVGFIRPEDFVS